MNLNIAAVGNDHVDVQGTLPEGTVIRDLDAHVDPRGAFTEVYADQWELPIVPEQWSIVRSTARVLRGMHVHWQHDEYFMVLAGRAMVGLHDIRPNSPTHGRGCLIDLRPETPSCLAFPRGILHGWYFPVPTLHLQGVSEAHSSYHPHDNQGCHFGDPALDIPWPDQAPILSQRAAGFPSLAELLAKNGG
ncbi:MAG: dTDP-4-dehydrorhamnose 3,5-epimerase family protein [Pseudomonadota bacterium]